MPDDLRSVFERDSNRDPEDGPPRRSPLRLLWMAVRAGIIGGIVFGVIAWAAGDPGPFQDGVRFGIAFAVFVLLVSLLRAPPGDSSSEGPR